jgi:NAD(P)-dependent dehydrogenase (short-subunit alcohol dehydrogenase family)
MILEEFRLDGKVAIVTGGGRGLGKTMAMALAEAGADMVIAARTESEIEQTAQEIQLLGRKALAIPTDIRKEQEVIRMAKDAVAQFGKIDILVNNAGLGLEKPFLEITEEEWKAVLDTNLTGMFFCCKAVGKYMLEQKKGKIINIASGLGVRGVEKGAAYCASKGGVIQLTKALALEWAPMGIYVNAIGPGWFPPSIGGQDYKEASSRLERFIPMKRRGKPEDLAGVVVYLASDSSSFITGETIWVDGALLTHL